MGKKSQTLGWSDTEELAFRLIDEHPDVDPTKLSPESVVELVLGLPDFGDRNKKPKLEVIEELQARWYEERADMEDELGPLQDMDIDEDLDEDEYRDDRLVEDSDEDDDSFSFDESYDEDDEDEEDLY